MKLYNTLTKRKEDFIPINKDCVKMYSCGPTVYNYFHIGNARPFIVFDLLRNFLEYINYRVIFVQNFTDIDDKMITKAKEENCSVQDIADKYINFYYQDADGLGVKRPTHQPRATETMDSIIEIVSGLVENGSAYVVEDGVYFDITSYADYGELSHFNLDELQSGASERITDHGHKKNPADFALWKFYKPGEPAWDSPWGKGRPGWHIECSAMIYAYLGESIDIHTGGQDLIFPHHENERAQSERFTKKPFVKYWLHNGFINVDNEKMSKSLNNFLTVHELSKRYSYASIRFFMLTGHYRFPINFSDDLLVSATHGLDRIKTCFENLSFFLSKHFGSPTQASVLREEAPQAKINFIEAMSDDLNTPDALAAVFVLVKAINTELTQETPDGEAIQIAKDVLVELMQVLGFSLEAEDDIPAAIVDLVQKRVQAKKDKDFALADAIRNEVTSLGYTIMDTPQGPKISKG